MDGVHWECGEPSESIFHEGTWEISYPQVLVVSNVPSLSQIPDYMFDIRFAGITIEFYEFGDFPSSRKFSLQHISKQRRCIVWPAHAYVYPISRHNPFDHGCQIVILCNFVLSNPMNNFVSVFVSIDHHYSWDFSLPMYLLFDPTGFSLLALVDFDTIGYKLLGLIYCWIFF